MQSGPVAFLGSNDFNTAKTFPGLMDISWMLAPVLRSRSGIKSGRWGSLLRSNVDCSKKNVFNRVGLETSDA